MVSSPRAGAFAQPIVPVDWDDEKEHRRLLAQKTNLILQGKMNNTREITFTANDTTTVMIDQRVGPKSFIHFMPLTLNAAGELGFYVSSQGDGTFTITHANDARTDRTFRYCILG